VTADLVVAGKLAIDELAIMNHHYQSVLGGSAAHCALAAATVGCSVAVVATIGTDFPSEFIYQLRAKKVDLSGVDQREGRSPWFQASFAPDGLMKDYAFRFGVGNQISLRTFRKRVSQAEAVHLGILPPHLQRKLLQGANRYECIRSMTTIAHQLKQHRERILPQLPLLDILFLNAEEAQILSDETNTAGAIEELGRQVPLVIVTQGDEGCLINNQGSVLQVPGIPIPQPVDFTGAGDSFAGAFLATYLQSGNVQLAAKWGNAAGAINVQAIGSTGIVAARRQDIERLVEAH
jgi:sugar/nucleoside kinase (ribokinase family)